ncbi:MAG TPA: ribosome-associated translation inhibitor RaiA [Pyrinomonadaceae bacterium]|nr:ribosome-associated translation inhibitor RaiA [Pyrinomonadaceae bacterium]
MIFEYSGRHIEITSALKAHIEEHFDKIDHVFDGKATKAHVIIEVERGRHRCEIVVNWRTEVLTATATSQDMYLSISQAVGKIEKQALKVKKKVIDKSHRAKRASSIVQKESELAPDPPGARIVQVNGYEVKPVTVDEATMLLEEREENFLVFRNADHQRVSVIYKRDDGNYGLIEP